MWMLVKKTLREKPGLPHQEHRFEVMRSHDPDKVLECFPIPTQKRFRIDVTNQPAADKLVQGGAPGCEPDVRVVRLLEKHRVKRIGKNIDNHVRRAEFFRLCAISFHLVGLGAPGFS